MRLLLPLWLASAALAANVTLTLTAPTTATAPGAAVAVPVTLTSVAGYEPAGLLFTVTWSAADLSAVSFALATGISKTGWCNPSAGKLVCAIAGLNLTKMANGTLGTLTATVAATAGVATTTLTLGPVSAGAPNAAQLGGAGASVAVPIVSKCDLTGDGKIDDADLAASAQQAIGAAACGSADLDADGACSVMDLLHIPLAAQGGACTLANPP
ncbi:MAG TPA: hypothetical protein VFA33_07700 [Bryobacteraceae bacterium]|nr:hypothetical protein [Bryobacteraceae bacterium]